MKNEHITRRTILASTALVGLSPLSGRALKADEDVTGTRGVQATGIPPVTAHWSFDEESNLGRDQSGNGHDLQLHNGPIQSTTDVPFSNREARSIRINGSNQFLSSNNAELFNPGRRSFTVSLWFRFNRPKRCFLIAKGNSFSRVEGWSLFVDEIQGKLCLVWRINSVPGELHRSGLFIPLDPDSIAGWHHVVGVIDRERQELAAYLNGAVGYDNRESRLQRENFEWSEIFNGRRLRPAEIISGEPLEIGRRSDGDWYFDGQIDDIKVYDANVLDQTQASSIAILDLLRFDDLTDRRLTEPDVRQVLNIRPVILPDESNTPEGNRHFGWPVATKAGQRLVVAYNRQLFHGRGGGNSSSSEVMVVTSDDGGGTWSEPTDLRSVERTPAAPQGIDGMRAIGSHNGKALILCTRGLFTLDGDRWSHNPYAYALSRLDVFPINRAPLSSHAGPYIAKLENSLLVFQSRSRGSQSSPIFVMGISDDGGMKWRQGQWLLPHPSRFQPVEPSALIHEGRIIVIARNFASPETRRSLMMLVAKAPGLPAGTAFPFHEKATNLGVPDCFRGGGLFDDTNDIMFNPIAQRIEVLVTNRASSYDEGCNEKMTLSLWSIALDDVINDRPTAMFTRECTLFYRRHRFGAGSPGGYDGMHAAGSVILNDRHHIFIYSGYKQPSDEVEYTVAAGIFQIIRSLDTPSLKRVLES